MNIFKLAGIIVVILGFIFLMNFLSDSQSKPKPVEKGFSDTLAEDDIRLRAEPQLSEPPPTVDIDADVAAEPEPAKPQFKELSQVEKIEAERLLEFAINQRKIGRLPGTGFGHMVKTCRDIIEKFPGTVYEFKAKRLLADMPERFRKRYKITEEEIDLGDLK